MPCPSNITWSTFTTNPCDSLAWSIGDEGRFLQYIVSDTIDCGGTCEEIQTGNASAIVDVGASEVYLTLQLVGSGEMQLSGKDEVLVFLNNQLIISGSSVGGGLTCTNGSLNLQYFRRPPYFLGPNTQHTIDVEFSTLDTQNQSGCFFYLSAITECTTVTPTPTPTNFTKPCRGVDCWCGRDCECVGENCPSPTPTPTQTNTPSNTVTQTVTPSNTPTPTVTPSTCYGCTLWTVTVTQGDLDNSPDGKVYVDYVPCESTTPIRVSYSYPGTYQEAICVNICYTPTICTDYTPSCVAPTQGSSLTNTMKNCKVVDPVCNETFSLNVSEPGYSEFYNLVDLGQSFGNLEVTISGTNFNEITEIFVGNLENGFGDSFIFDKGRFTQTKTVGFFTQRNKSKLDISIYSQGTTQNPFSANTITFKVLCPTTIPCIEPSPTPTQTVTQTNTSTPTPTPTNTITPSVTPSNTSTPPVTPTNTETTTQTPTQTPSVPYCCYQYEITNYYTTTVTVYYTDCDGNPGSVNATGNGQQTYINCARPGSISYAGDACDGGNVDCISINQSSLSCNNCEASPTPTPTHTITPTKTNTPTPTQTPTNCFYDATFTEVFTPPYTPDPPGQPAPCSSGMDVVFVVDYTGSMGGVINGIKNSIASIASTIVTESNNNYRLGLVIFDESEGQQNSYTSDPGYTSLPASQKYVLQGRSSFVNSSSNYNFYIFITAVEKMSLNNQSSFTTQLNKLNTAQFSLGDGLAGPEPSDLAVNLVATNNIVGYNYFAGTFRSGVSKIIILITDNLPSGTDDRYDANDVAYVNSLIQPLYNQNIRVLLMTTASNNILYTLATSTNGLVSNGFSGAQIIKAIQDICP